VRFRPADGLLVLIVLIMLPVTMLHYENIPDANALLGFARVLQYATPFLIATMSALCVLLYRISTEMGGGEFSKCLRALIAFLFLRLGAHLLFTFPWGAWALVIRMYIAIAWSSIDGVFVLALAYRWEIGRLADQALARYESGELHLTVPRAAR
jgi:hypothetical protein